MLSPRYALRRVNSSLDASEQIRHRQQVFFAGFIGGKQGKLGGNAVQVEVGAPGCQRTGFRNLRWLPAATQTHRPATSPSSRCDVIFNARLADRKETTRCGLESMN